MLQTIPSVRENELSSSRLENEPGNALNQTFSRALGGSLMMKNSMKAMGGAQRFILPGMGGAQGDRRGVTLYQKPTGETLIKKTPTSK